MNYWYRAFICSTVLIAIALFGSFGAAAMNPNMDADIKSVSIPAKLEIGKSARVTVVVTNEGYIDWKKFSPILLSHIVSGANTPELVPKVDLKHARSSGDTWTFQYDITGPDLPGVYEIEWQMATTSGKRFGSCEKKKIEIYGVNREAKIHEGDIKYDPNPVHAGKTFRFKVVVNNVGDVPFAAYNPTLKAKVMKKPNKSVVTCLQQSFNTRFFKPNGKKWTFEKTLQAPTTEGAYMIRWQMYDGSSAFGESADKTINVVN